jgi:hypothetical protein
MQFRLIVRRDTTSPASRSRLATQLEGNLAMIRSITQRLETAISALATAFLLGPLVVASAMFLTTSV